MKAKVLIISPSIIWVFIKVPLEYRFDTLSIKSVFRLGVSHSVTEQLLQLVVR